MLNKNDFVEISRVFFKHFINLAKLIFYMSIIRSLLFLTYEYIHDPFGLCTYQVSQVFEPTLLQNLFGNKTQILYYNKRTDNLMCNVILELSCIFKFFSFNFTNQTTINLFLSIFTFWIRLCFFFLIYFFIIKLIFIYISGFIKQLKLIKLN